MSCFHLGSRIAALSMLLGLCVGSIPANAQVAPPITVLYNFTAGNDGDGPVASMIQGKDGAFYGTAGGFDTYGSVFRITPSGAFTPLYTFTGNGDGAYPYAPVVEDRNGVLYGTTTYGGDLGNGEVYQLSPLTGLSVLHSFNYTDGANPYSGLIFGKGGALYGTTSGGGKHGNGGTIFRITTSGMLTTLLSFNYADGLMPIASLLTDRDGNLYGTTYYGGAYGVNGVYGSVDNGTIFVFLPDVSFLSYYTLSPTINYSPLTNRDGANPGANLIRDSAGNLYTTTTDGGMNGFGTVFEYTATGTPLVLYTFTGGSDGGNPLGGLVFGKDGALYGTTSAGGDFGNGTVFRLGADGTLTTLHSFGLTGDDSGFPAAGLTLGRDGNFYGSTANGGTNSRGMIFKLTMTPLVSGFTPSSGPVGTQVNVSGVNFTETTGVVVDGIAAAFTVNSDTSLTVTIPAGATKGRIKVINPFGSGRSSKDFKVTH